MIAIHLSRRRSWHRLCDLLHRVGYHRFCEPTWRRVGLTNGTTSNTAVLLFADDREHR